MTTHSTDIDTTLAAIVAFTSRTRSQALSPEAVEATIAHCVDALGCAAGGFSAEPCRIARTLAAGSATAAGCSAFGLDQATTPELAVFANAGAVRQLDFNDTYAGRVIGGGHPSDLIPAMLAGVELAGGSGRDLLAGVYVAYEVFAAIADAIPLRDLGLDQGANIAAAAAAGLAHVLRLDDRQTACAVSLALMPNVPLRVVRTGQLTHWKGCAAPHAAAMAMWAARLARAGMTAPMDPFHGVDGLERLTGPFDLGPIGDPIDGRSAIERCLIKHYPSELSSQAPIETMLRMRDRVLDSEIDAIEVETYHLAWHEIGGGQDDAEAKWNPTTRETADHSLPYLLAVALVDGEVTPRSFTAERIADPALRPVMQKVTIGPDDDLERRFRSGRQEMVVRIRIRLASGDVIADEADFPRGHHMNPMSDAELDAKFMSMAPDVLPEGEAGRMLHLVRQLGEQDTLDELTGLLRHWRGRATAASPLAQAGADHVRR